MTQKYEGPVIDVHTHVFNALCLPLEGLILEMLEEDESLSTTSHLVKRAMARALARLIEELAAGESRLFEGDEAGLVWLKRVTGDKGIEELEELLTKAIVSQFIYETGRQPIEANRLRRADGFAAAFDWVVREFNQAKEFQDYSPLDVFEPGKTPSREAFDPWRETWSDAVVKFLHQVFGTHAEGERYLRFFCLLLAPQSSIINRLLMSYSEPREVSSPAAKVTLFVQHMMDMELAYSRYKWARPPAKDYEDKQVPAMAYYHQNIGDGRTLWFVAFDPRRRKLHHEHPSMEIVKDALSRGACGVKFYPSLGYKPVENEKKWVQRAVDELFSYCCENKVPILAHCQLGRWKGDDDWDQYSNPDLWEMALNRFPGLTLCLAHAGGGIHKRSDGWSSRDEEYGWFSKDSEEWNNGKHWAKKVVELCCNAKFPNVYCDMSAMWPIIDDTSQLDPPASERFTRIFKHLLLANQSLPRKIMYGSDWHMPSVLGRSSKYLGFFVDLFSKEQELGDYARDFFFQNARRFLMLDQYVEKRKSCISPEAYDYLKNLARIEEE
jgi:predicted TIM-barrel fold metal-dependent hydrolase